MLITNVLNHSGPVQTNGASRKHVDLWKRNADCIFRGYPGKQWLWKGLSGSYWRISWTCAPSAMLWQNRWIGTISIKRSGEHKCGNSFLPVQNVGEADARLFVLHPIPTFVMTWKSTSTEKNPQGFYWV